VRGLVGHESDVDPAELDDATSSEIELTENPVPAGEVLEQRSMTTIAQRLWELGTKQKRLNKFEVMRSESIGFILLSIAVSFVYALVLQSFFIAEAPTRHYDDLSTGTLYLLAFNCLAPSCLLAPFYVLFFARNFIALYIRGKVDGKECNSNLRYLNEYSFWQVTVFVQYFMLFGRSGYDLSSISYSWAVAGLYTPFSIRMNSPHNNLILMIYFFVLLTSYAYFFRVFAYVARAESNKYDQTMQNIRYRQEKGILRKSSYNFPSDEEVAKELLGKHVEGDPGIISKSSPFRTRLCHSLCFSWRKGPWCGTNPCSAYWDVTQGIVGNIDFTRTIEPHCQPLRFLVEVLYGTFNYIYVVKDFLLIAAVYMLIFGIGSMRCRFFYVGTVNW
jgi:hypothetical protein